MKSNKKGRKAPTRYYTYAEVDEALRKRPHLELNDDYREEVMY